MDNIELPKGKLEMAVGELNYASNALRTMIMKFRDLDRDLNTIRLEMMRLQSHKDVLHRYIYRTCTLCVRETEKVRDRQRNTTEEKERETKERMGPMDMYTLYSETSII